MESNVAKRVRQDLEQAIQRMSRTDRLKAFVAHSMMLMQIHLAGRRYREKKQR